MDAAAPSRSAMQFHKQGIATIPSRVSRVSDTLGTIYIALTVFRTDRTTSTHDKNLIVKSDFFWSLALSNYYLSHLGIICEICTIKRREGNVTQQLFESLKRITLLTAPSVFGYIFIKSSCEGNEEVRHCQINFSGRIPCVQVKILKFYPEKKLCGLSRLA